ncbi:MAG: nucleotide exchange factor GrpE [Mycoplasmataceae bacterium]|jgi:molecular chaperone GrpE|nr:nucleotide exchange factor GrpE [Mycoplasmataceae bacterium]
MPNNKKHTVPHNEPAHKAKEEVTVEAKTAHVEPKAEVLEQKLVREIEALTIKLAEKDSRIASLENQIAQINADYVNKVKEKTDQANEQLKLKVEELTHKANQELATHKKYAIEKSAAELIEIINQFDVAVSHKIEDEKIKNYQTGFKMFLTMFQNLLGELGINVIEVKKGDTFDPLIMECLEFQHSTELEENKVISIVAKGYKLYDRIIKPAIVILAKKMN